jgi:hypothetical protein
MMMEINTKPTCSVEKWYTSWNTYGIAAKNEKRVANSNAEYKQNKVVIGSIASMSKGRKSATVMKSFSLIRRGGGGGIGWPSCFALRFLRIG